MIAMFEMLQDAIKRHGYYILLPTFQTFIKGQEVETLEIFN